MPASIFAGSKVKTLKSTLSLNGGADIISSSTTNPQTSAVSAEPGSLLLNTTSGIMYRKLDAGLTTNWVEVGAGSGGKNYIKNPDFDGGATTSWSMQKVSLSSLVPTGNIGAADAGHTIATSSSSPLEGANSLLVQGASAFTAGNCLVSAAFAIDREDQAKVMGWSFYYEAVTTNMDFPGTSAGTWAVYIAEVTTATPDTVVSWIQPAGVYNLVQSSGAGIASGTFQTTATGTAYRLVLVCINNEAAATTLKVDDFQLGPQKVLQGPSGPVGEIIATGSVTPPAGFLYCNGQSVSVSQYQDLFNSIGYTYGGSGANFNVPDLRGVFLRGAGSQTIGAETYTATLGSAQNDATAKNGLYDSGHTHSTSYGYVSSTKPGTGFAAFGAYYASDTGVASGSANLTSTDTETRPANVAVAYHIRYLATYQMSQDTDTRVVAASGLLDSTTFSSGQSILHNTAVPIGFLGNLQDTHSAWTAGSGFDAATGLWGGAGNPTRPRYTVPVSGTYTISANIAFDNFNSTQETSIILFVNNVQYDNTIVTGVGSGGFWSGASGSINVPLLAGQVVDVRAFQFSGGARTLTGGRCNFSISRLSGPATIAASESVVASAQRSTADGAQTYSTSPGQTFRCFTDYFPTDNVDTHGILTNTASETYATIPVSGVYEISRMCRYVASSTTLVIQNYILLGGTNQTNAASLDGVSLAASISNTVTASDGSTISVSYVGRLNAGDIIRFKCLKYGDTNMTMLGGGTSQISIKKVGN